MAERKEFWSQLLTLLLQTVVPLAIAGGATGIFSVFKESLPQLLYTIFLYVIWGGIVAMLIWLVLRLVLGDSPQKLIKWIKERRRYSARKKLVKEWHSKFARLVQLMKEVMQEGWQPTRKQEEDYSGLHSWFIENRSRFLPVWHNFRSSRTRPAHERQYNSSTFAYQALELNYWDDPFSYFYEPLQITEFSKILQYRRDDEIGRVLSKLVELIGELSQWIK